MSVKDPVRHHYIPRFVLSNFASNPKHRMKKVFVFDKWENKIFQTNVNNVGCENHFYDFKALGVDFTAEYGLAKVDGDAAPLIRKLVDNENLCSLTEEEKVLLAFFMAIQITRVPQRRDMVSELYNDLYNMFGDQYGVQEINGEKKPSAEKIKADTCINMPDCKIYAMALLAKEWFLIRAPEGEPFQISDNPLVMQNNRKPDTFWGNLGMECTGIEIYFPLSKDIVLAMYCPSHFENWTKMLGRAKALSIFDPRAFLAGEIQSKVKKWEEMLKAPKAGTPITVSGGVVTNVNSLQTMWARRYVFSSNNNFSLSQKMLREFPEYKDGMRIKIQK